jgi:phage uncharacterized protein TIGR01671
MREHEYRAWHKQDQKMYKVTSITLGVQYGMAPSDLVNYVDLYDKSKSYRDGEDIELMQYTRLKDKNDTKIFESDILRLGYSDGSFYKKPVEVKYGLHCVGYDSDAATVGSALGFYFSPYPDHEWSGIGATFNWDDAEYSEVIGNIYEHTWLLKGK